MASWGRKSDFALSGTGSIDANTNIVIGANTAFTTQLQTRNVVDIDGSRFVVVAVANNTQMTVEPISSVAHEDQALLMSQTPKYLPTTIATDEATYVTVAEAKDANNRVIGVKTPGWTLYKEYGTDRRRVETLVAMKSTT
jgi:hypothetical protein